MKMKSSQMKGKNFPAYMIKAVVRIEIGVS